MILTVRIVHSSNRILSSVRAVTLIKNYFGNRYFGNVDPKHRDGLQTKSQFQTKTLKSMNLTVMARSRSSAIALNRNVLLRSIVGLVKVFLVGSRGHFRHGVLVAAIFIRVIMTRRKATTA